MMLSENPKQAILAWLRNESSFPDNEEVAAPADPHSVRFLKERAIPGHKCHAITWVDLSGRNWFGVIGVAQHSSGQWYMNGGGWGSGHLPEPIPGPPHAFLAGARGDHLYMGSWVEDPTNSVAFVRLVSDNQPIAEDTVEDGIVLFVAPVAATANLMVELYDSEGELLKRHEP